MEGLKYDIATSVFSDADEVMPSDYNVLDVYIGDVRFEESELVKLDAFSDDVRSELSTLVTSDFYNFDTESSGICEGINTNYNLQLSYKVRVDDYLL